MRNTPQEPMDTDLTLGRPIRQPAPAKPDTVRPFEQGDHSGGIGNQSKALESIAETIRKQIAPVSPGKAEEWEGLCLDPVALSFLNFI